MNRRVLLLTPLLIACGGFFYESPPPLVTYPQRVPGKDWSEILESVKPFNPYYTSDRNMAGVSRLATDFPKLSVAGRLAQLNDLTIRNREGEFGAQTANLLTEMHEMAEDEATVQAAQDYLVWRCSNEGLEWRNLGREPVRNWQETADQTLARIKEYQTRKDRAEANLEEHLQNPPALLIPNYRVQRAAFKMEHGDYEGALQDFRQVRAEFPEHPRAEVAAFMIGRTLLEQSRAERRHQKDLWGDDYNLSKARIDAVTAFQDYLRQYPQGRFVADAHGWLGGAAADGGFYGEAIGHQLDRLEVRSTREVLRSVLRDAENLLNKLFARNEYDPQELPDAAAQAGTLPWDKLARHPEVARLFLIHALDPTATDHRDHSFEDYGDDAVKLEVLNRRIVLPQPFAHRALESLAAAMAKAGPGEGKEDPLTLQVTGWSALRHGKAEQAVALFDRALAVRKSDELLEARAMALSELNRHPEATASYDALFQDFPDSSLAEPLRLRRAIARCHAGQAGSALVELFELTGEDQPDREDHDLIPRTEMTQWIRTICDFSPLDELAEPLNNLPAQDPRAYALREILRTREIARERFDLAKLYLDPQQSPSDPNRVESYADTLRRSTRMDQQRWDQEVEPLAKATRESNWHGKASAQAELKLARLWRDLPGSVLSRQGNEDGLSRENALLLGLDTAASTAELDSRYPLFHARAHFLHASELHDKATELTTLEETNELLPKLAFLYPDRLARAVAMNETEVSARLVARMRKIAPGSPEAARAVAWSFLPMGEDEKWRPGNHPDWWAEPSILAAISDPVKSFERDYDDDEGREPQDPKVVIPGIADLINGTLPNLTAVKTKLANLRLDYDARRSSLRPVDLFRAGAALDDLDAAAGLPGMTTDLFHRYAAVRVGDAHATFPLEGEWLPLAPLFDYRECAEKIGRRHVVSDPADWALTAWQDYMKQYPAGPKTEAARLQLLRVQVYRRRPTPRVRDGHFPEIPGDTDYKHLAFDVAELAFDEEGNLKSLLADLNAYLKDYPRSRYLADIRQLRATLLADTGDYATAINDLTTILRDPSHRELHQDAALRFAEIAQRLWDPQQRARVAQAFRTNPAARGLLENLAKGDTCLFLLRPMLRWLQN